MSLFPQIGPGILSQLPYAEGANFLTSVDEVPSGFRGTYRWRDKPLGMWGLSFSKVLPAEFTALKSFYDSMQGEWGSFTFLDPAGNQVQSMDVSDASWTRNATTVGAIGLTDPFGGSLAQLLTSTGDCYVLTPCFVDDIIGWRVSIVVWLRLVTSSPLDVNLQFETQSNIYKTSVHLTQGVWTRGSLSILVTDHVSDVNPAYLQIGGSSIPSSSQLQIFCPMASSMAACGGAVFSPQNYGRHQYCRFDQDTTLAQEFPQNPNVRQTSLKIVEVHT